MTIFDSVLRRPEAGLPIVEFGLRAHARRYWGKKSWSWEHVLNTVQGSLGKPEMFLAHAFHVRNAAKMNGYRPVDHLVTQDEQVPEALATVGAQFSQQADLLYSHRADAEMVQALLLDMRQTLRTMRIRHAENYSVAV